MLSLSSGRGIPVAPYQGVQAAGDLEGTAIRLHDAWSKNSESPINMTPPPTKLEYRVPQNGWFIMENPIKVDDLGVPPF